MVDQEGGSFVPGPLDELVPGLRARQERLPPLVAHPRVSRVGGDDGRDAMVLASFASTGSPRALHKALQPVVEASLLSVLSEPQGPSTRPLDALELYTFAPLPFEPDAALALLGFARWPLEHRPQGTRTRKALALLRHEAQQLTTPVEQEPLLAFRAVFSQPAALADTAATILRSEGQAPAFGVEPGALARRLAHALHGLGFSGVAPTRVGIERLESLLIQQTPGSIRWIDPLCFQALCDLIAVAAHDTWDAQVEWGVCEPDPETGLAPPPLVRVVKPRDGSAGHVPLGEHVLRWAVMPRQVGEEIPTLGAWAEHEFT